MSKDVINVMTKRLTCLEIPKNSYTFNISLANNAVDNSYYRRTKQTIFELFEQLNGIYCIDDIFEESAIFETCITESEDNENPDGSYVELSAKAFIPITTESENALNILKTIEKNSKNNIIKAGVLFVAKSMSCSICGKSSMSCCHCHEPEQIYFGKKFYRNVQGVAQIDGWYVKGLNKNTNTPKNTKIDTSYLIKQLEEKLLECQNIIKEIKNV